MKWEETEDEDRQAQDRQILAFMFSYFCITWDTIQTYSDSNSVNGVISVNRLNRLKWPVVQAESEPGI
jgi:replication initiation and membrane attachment protein DnaB